MNKESFNKFLTFLFCLKKQAVCNLDNNYYSLHNKHLWNSRAPLHSLQFCHSLPQHYTQINCYLVQSCQESFNVSPANSKTKDGCYLTAAVLAQSVERLTGEQKVEGSIPRVGPILRVLK